MFRRLFSLYQRRRIININANILAAGLLAIGCSKLVVMAVDHWTTLDEKSVWFTAIGAGSDIIFDIIVYYVLHWIANHWRPLRPKCEKEKRHHERKPRPFLKDASLIQFERALLGPLYYGIGMGLMYLLQQNGMKPSNALIIAFPIGLVISRVVHTAWGLQSGRFHDEPRSGVSVDAPPRPVTEPAPDAEEPVATRRGA